MGLAERLLDERHSASQDGAHRPLLLFVVVDAESVVLDHWLDALLVQREVLLPRRQKLLARRDNVCDAERLARVRLGLGLGI